jgi:hypothetical protein
MGMYIGLLGYGSRIYKSIFTKLGMLIPLDGAELT